MRTIIRNKEKICATRNECFTDIQGLGGDAMFLRYDDFVQILRRNGLESLVGYFAEPAYDDMTDTIMWYTEKWETAPAPISTLEEDEQRMYRGIKQQILSQFYAAIKTANPKDAQDITNALKDNEDDFLYCFDGKVVIVAWGMRVDNNCYSPQTSISWSASKPRKVVVFNAGEKGLIEGRQSFRLSRPQGHVITEKDLPHVAPFEEYRFVGWSGSPVGSTVKDGLSFDAQYELIEPVIPDPPLPPIEPPIEPEQFECRFDAGEHGSLKGEESGMYPSGYTLSALDIPVVTPKKGYEFAGWDTDPSMCTMDSNKVFTAQYNKKLPWYKRFWLWLCGLFRSFWLWLTGLRFWRFLRWLLLALLILLLLSLFLRGCGGCSHGVHYRPVIPRGAGWRADDPNIGRGGIYNPGNPYTTPETPDQYKDVLPGREGVMPPIDEREIIRDPNAPDVVGNELIVLMENEDKSIMDLARAFKTQYPGDQYKVVYYDDVSKVMKIQVPSTERLAIKTALPSQMAPQFDVSVLDETLFETSYQPQDPDFQDAQKSWYLKAVNACEAWDQTKGGDSIIVAVVDNGFNLSHPEFKDRIVQPFNVWDHSDNVASNSSGRLARDLRAGKVDHGTHVAGTLLANMDNAKGLCGIAQNCQFMPVKVADEHGIMTTLSIINGILCAIYQGADVINVSLGMNLPSNLSAAQQLDLQNNHFVEEERFWSIVSRVADRHKAIVVFAAGNNNILAGIDPSHRPENFIVVSAVSAAGQSLDKASFSNHGDYAKISAPGEPIYSCYGRNGYAVMQGTSMAAPIVSGAVALMKSINRDITAQQALCALRSTGKDVNEKIGRLIQIDKALEYVKEGDYSQCVQQEEADHPVPISGDVQVYLSWHNTNDIDLYCQDPFGKIVWYRCRQVPSGGLLQYDMNAGGNWSSEPTENIYWPTGGAPDGQYKVMVRYYERHDQVLPTDYSVMVKYGNKTETYTGTMQSVGQMDEVCTFVLGTGNPNPDGGVADGGVAPGSGVVVPRQGAAPVDGGRQVNNPGRDQNGTDYGSIRDEITRLEGRIRDLKRQLPENNR